MKLIADSGSTKTSWALLGEKTERFETIGLNPVYLSDDRIRDVINDSELKARAEEISEVHFYGSGVSSEDRKARIDGILNEIFNSENHIYHDIAGAAHATVTRGEPAICCILGTGSNSCLFDGRDVYEGLPSLGFILGDEGSGGDIAKGFIRALLYNQLESATRRAFKDEFGYTKDDIIEHTYRKERPNTWLARFAKFVIERMDSDQRLKDIVKQSLESFINTHVMHYPNFQNMPVHFVGSIAFNTKEVLEEICNARKINLGNVVAEPIEGLIKWHNS